MFFLVCLFDCLFNHYGLSNYLSYFFVSLTPSTPSETDLKVLYSQLNMTYGIRNLLHQAIGQFENIYREKQLHVRPHL